MMKYTLARLLLFVVVAAVLIAIPVHINPLIKLMIAVIVSALLALFLLRGMRDEVANQMAGAASRVASSAQHTVPNSLTICAPAERRRCHTPSAARVGSATTATRAASPRSNGPPVPRRRSREPAPRYRRCRRSQRTVTIRL